MSPATERQPAINRQQLKKYLDDAYRLNTGFEFSGNIGTRQQDIDKIIGQEAVRQFIVQLCVKVGIPAPEGRDVIKGVPIKYVDADEPETAVGGA